MHEPQLPNDWLSTALGRRCLDNEQRLVQRALEQMFGEQLLQIGSWGGVDSFLPFARTQRAACLDWRGTADVDVLSHTDRLAVASDSVDVVLLPHTLELIPSPHALLREVDRILRADGYIVALSFSPNGAWGLRHLLSRNGYPQLNQRLIREGRLRDWLELLNFEVGSRQRYLNTLPFEKLRRFGTLPEESWLTRWCPGLSGGYLLCAQKRVQPLTPIRRPWQRRHLKVVGGLVEPTTRVSQRRQYR
ncbi:MAG: class I SAM-dependent methyltransferase [Candidatus Rariloculaceae bacterium]